MVTLIRSGAPPSSFFASLWADSSARHAEASLRASRRTVPVWLAQAARPQAIVAAARHSRRAYNPQGLPSPRVTITRDAMAEVLYYAIPFFVLLLVLEYLSFRQVRAENEGLIGFEARDTRTSLTMGLGNVVINFGWKFVVLAAYVGIYELTPLRLDPGDWWVWVLLFFADDFSYYWFHRISHESRGFWASHVVHHSSQHYNLSTALRQTWVPMTYFPFWLWMPAVGFEPWMVLLAQAWSLIYQFWIHTEKIRKLPRWFEAVFNTPSHHRVHHGVNDQYLDRNYAGILIIWDRLFGTYEPEGERVRYGLTTQLRHLPAGAGRLPRVHRDVARHQARARAFVTSSESSSAAPVGRPPGSPSPRRRADSAGTTRLRHTKFHHKTD